MCFIEEYYFIRLICMTNIQKIKVVFSPRNVTDEKGVLTNGYLDSRSIYNLKFDQDSRTIRQNQDFLSIEEEHFG